MTESKPFETHAALYVYRRRRTAGRLEGAFCAWVRIGLAIVTGDLRASTGDRVLNRARSICLIRLNSVANSSAIPVAFRHLFRIPDASIFGEGFAAPSSIQRIGRVADWPVRGGLVLPDVVVWQAPPLSDVGAFVDRPEELLRLGELVEQLIGQLAQRI